MSTTRSHDLHDIDLVSFVEEAKRDAVHAFNFLRDTGTLSASLTFHVSHRIPGHDRLLTIRFPSPWDGDRSPRVSVSRFSDHPESILNEERLDADTLIHAHTPYLAGWSLAHKPFPILYVAAQRHLLAREIPNHLERTRSVLEVVRERLDRHPELAPPPALLESNGGANFWGRGIIKTAQLILLIEEAARFQAIAEQIGGAQPYTPGAIELQWKRTGLLEKALAYKG
ncbi:MAG: class II aldolase/adducin family protein [Methyloversatilis discipulorum]|uniref:class II aldolase/adducin family protein n=1 Tax=Methyloversatilis discipulorum TaxID=1119528 RepID=UPI0026E92243|nr:class II aldolase/adducin family protein [Methyloversatilis discipulorum]MBT9516001.1 class II aldolase/adducin family protein [Methyloversatilis discipulorum]